MCGRGIDQVLAHPCSPKIYEDYMRSAEDYVLLAEQANGPIPRPSGPAYVWGDYEAARWGSSRGMQLTWINGHFQNSAILVAMGEFDQWEKVAPIQR
jgi:hypothetical protein